MLRIYRSKVPTGIDSDTKLPSSRIQRWRNGSSTSTHLWFCIYVALHDRSERHTEMVGGIYNCTPNCYCHPTLKHSCLLRTALQEPLEKTTPSQFLCSSRTTSMISMIHSSGGITHHIIMLSLQPICSSYKKHRQRKSQCLHQFRISHMKGKQARACTSSLEEDGLCFS